MQYPCATSGRKAPEERVAPVQAKAEPIFGEPENWLHAQLPKVSCKSLLAKPIHPRLGRMPKARPYLENGFLELDNNTAERAVVVAIGRKNWMFARSQGGGKAMAIAHTSIETAKLNKVDLQAWRTRVLGQIAHQKIARLAVMLPEQYKGGCRRRARTPSPETGTFSLSDISGEGITCAQGKGLPVPLLRMASAVSETEFGQLTL